MPIIKDRVSAAFLTGVAGHSFSAPEPEPKPRHIPVAEVPPAESPKGSATRTFLYVGKGETPPKFVLGGPVGGQPIVERPAAPRITDVKPEPPKKDRLLEMFTAGVSVGAVKTRREEASVEPFQPSRAEVLDDEELGDEEE